MDLSLLSDADIRAADARIRELWARPMRIVIGVPPEARASARVQRVPLSLYSSQAWCPEFGVRVVWDGQQRVDIPPPKSVDDVIWTWRDCVDELLRRLHRRLVQSTDSDPPPTVYDIVVDSDCDSSLWLPRVTLTRKSRKRLGRILEASE